jgi:hypothetical protein
MFLPIKFCSVNSPEDLAPGRYMASSTWYGRATDICMVLLVQYARDAGAQPAGVDLLVIEPDGTLRARDFAWLSDRSWRDSDGARANRLNALLPVELLRLQVVRSEHLGEIKVGDSE